MQPIAWWPTLLVMMIATVTDIRSQRIPNQLVVPFLVGGIVVSTAVDGWSGLSRSLLGMLLAVVLMGLLYVLGGMGMGDVKLCAGLGAWVGSQQLLFALAFMGLAGGLMAFCWAIFGGFLNEALTGSAELIFGFGKRGLRPHPELVLSNPAARRMPYAPAIAVGAVLSFFVQS